MSGPDEEGLDPSHSGSEVGANKLFLGGLSWDSTEDKLRAHFQTYGEIVEVVVMRDRGTGRPRGFGFITYKDPSVADRVVKDIHAVDGRQIDVKKSVPQEGKPKACKVFVGGLSPETSEADFKAYFSSFGQVAEVQIMQDHMSGRSRGFGFVTFEEDSSAEKVFAAGPMHELGGKQVEVKHATPKGSGSQGSGGGGGSTAGGGGGKGAQGGAPRGRTSGEYAHNVMGYAAGGSSPYGMYGGMYSYPQGPGGRPGSMMQPYPMPQFSTMPPQQYMMMQPPSLANYGPPYGPSGAYPGAYSSPPQGGLGPFSSASPQQALASGLYSSSGSPSPPQRISSGGYHGPGKAHSGRSKVDSASSLDQHENEAERHLKRLSLTENA